MKDKTELWLMQKYDNGDFYMYRWTPMLAKKGYKVMTEAQAKPFVQMMKTGKNNVKHIDERSVSLVYDTAKETDHKAGFMIDAPIPEMVDEDSETRAIVAEAVGTHAEGAGNDLDKVRDICIGQEDIQAQEMKFIKSLQHKSSLERHMLEKYQAEVPVGRLDAMKALANQMICEFAKEERLYLVDGGVIMK